MRSLSKHFFYPHEMIAYENIQQYYCIIAVIFSFIFLSVVCMLIYHGAFYNVEVKSTKPPFKGDMFVAYKFTQDYSKSRVLLNEAQSIAPNLDSFSIYHENFVQTRSQVGSSVGVVLSENMDESLYTKLIEAGFKIQIFPAIDFAVVAVFPYKNQYSLAIAVYRTYPMLKHYIKANRLCAHPIMELYCKDKIYFIAPLSKQFDFYAEEAIIDYDPSTSEDDDNEYMYINSKHDKHYYKQHAVQTCSYCDPLLHSSSCDRCKRAL